MHVVIIGAGIGGLAVAAGLSRSGHDVVVLERAGSLSPVGAGISWFANGYRALDVIGVGDRLRVPHDPHVVTGQRTPSGRLLARIPTDPTVELGVIHPADLHDQLRQAASRAGLRLGTEAIAISEGDVLVRGSSRHEEGREHAAGLMLRGRDRGGEAPLRAVASTHSAADRRDVARGGDAARHQRPRTAPADLCPRTDRAAR